MAQQPQSRPDVQHNRQPAPLFAPNGPFFYDQDKDPPPKAPRGRGESSKSGSAGHSGSNLLYNIAIVIFAAIFLVCAGLLVKRFLDDRRLAGEVSELESLIETDPVSDTTPEGDTPATGEQAGSNAEKFARLLERNPDFIGWIRIEDTNLSFPVMQSPDRRDFYLNHNFEGEYDVYGVPYLDEDCTVQQDATSNNLIIYGHHMKSGTVFGSLPNYRNESYYQEHPYVQFDTLYGDGQYQVFAGFAIDVVTDNFAFNTYIDMDQAAFDEFVSQVKSRSDVDSGITPEYGDQLLTLSTCDYSSDNGRYVVVARRVDP